MFRTRKWWVICLSVVALFALAPFAITHSFLWLLDQKAQEAGYEIAYEKPLVGYRSLQLNDLVLTGKNGGKPLMAKTVTLDYFFNPLTMTLSANLDWDNLNIIAEPESFEPLLSNSAEANFPKWLHLNVTVKAPSAALHLPAKGETHTYTGSIEHSFSDLHRGKYTFRSTHQNDAFLTLSFDDVNLAVEAHNAHASLLRSLISPLIPALNRLEISSGILEGSLKLNTQTPSSPEVNGDLILSNVSIIDKSNGSSLNLQELRLNAPGEKAPVEARLVNGNLYIHDGKEEARLNNFQGRISLERNLHFQASLETHLQAFQETSYLILRTAGDLPNFTHSSLHLALHHSDKANTISSIDIKAGNVRDENKRITLEIRNIRDREFLVLQSALNTTFPSYNPIRFSSGTVSGNFDLEFHNGSLSELIAKSVEADNLFFLLKSWEIEAGAKQVKGRFRLGFKEQGEIDALESDLQIHQGEVLFSGLESNLWHFKEIETALVIKHGVLQKSSASVSLGGLKGRAEILESKNSEFLRFSFHGRGNDLVPFLPERLQNGLRQGLLDDSVLLEGGLSKGERGAELSGALKIASTTETDSPPIHFGVSIEKLAPFLQGSPEGMDRAEKTLKTIALPILRELTPSSILGGARIETQFLLRETGYSSFTLRGGWARAKGLDLSRFISPFLFPENEMRLSGKADLEAHFDLAGITLSYQGSQVILENKGLSIEVPTIGNSQNPYPAKSHFDFLTGAHIGSLPIEEGTYFDKDNGLLFTGIHGGVLFEGQKVIMDHVMGFSSGIYFAGSLNVDYSSPEKGVFDVELRIKEMDGQFSQLQHLYAHFEKDSLIAKIPLESKIAMGPKMGLLQFHVLPEDYTLEAIFDCLVQEGVIDAPQADLSFRELSLNVLYDHQKGILNLDSIQSTLLIGVKEPSGEFQLNRGSITFSNFKNSEGTFDVALEDDRVEFLRLKGRCFPKEGLTEVALDNSTTHFGNIHPADLRMQFRGWERVENFFFRAPFRLSTLIHDLRRFQKTGLPFLSPELIAEMANLNTASGEFEANLTFDGESNKLHYALTGREVHVEDRQFKKLSLQGYKSENRWLVEELNLDEISIAAEVLKRDLDWQVDFLGIKLSEGCLIGLSGVYRHGDPKIHAEINLLDIDLTKMTDWMAVSPLLETLQPKGKIKGTGAVAFEYSPTRGWIVDANIDTSFHEIAWKDFSFNNSEHVNCSFRSDRGVTLSNLKTTLTKNSIRAAKIDLDVNEVDFEFASQRLHVDGFKFEIDPTLLPTITAELHQELPKIFTEEISTLLSQLKKRESLRGEIAAAFQPGSIDLELKLPQGSYHLWDDERVLSQFTLNFVDDEIKVSTQYLLNKEYIWIAFRLNPDQLEYGEILFADTYATDSEETPLKVKWKLDPQIGLIISSAAGNLSGLKFDLKEDLLQPTTEDSFRMQGTILIDGTRAKNILPELQRAALETLQVGKGYQIQGSFAVSKEVETSGDRNVRFFGTVDGRDVELKGYEFNFLHAQVLMEPDSFQMFDLSLSDPAGALYIGNISGKKELEGNWKLSIPLASVYDFRPSLLKEIGKPYDNKRKPLIVRQLFVQDIEGILGDSDSFKGHGNLFFDNPQKKNLQNTLFAIPGEILTRIGLNLSVLTPVSGTIFYDIQSGKIYLTKFKDVYSDRKISKFYLSNNGAPSTIDFDGNLDVQVRFKQSTLLLKLVELFMINVQGTITKPTYSLQRQKYLMKEDLYISNKAVNE